MQTCKYTIKQYAYLNNFIFYVKYYIRATGLTFILFVKTFIPNYNFKSKKQVMVSKLNFAQSYYRRAHHIYLDHYCEDVLGEKVIKRDARTIFKKRTSYVVLVKAEPCIKCLHND
ncbi:MAG TPA: hypothetical protein DDE71_06340 [Tenacibaculum sp.]|nr:hypothetical protein [Tenacibaculum sp.]